MSKITLSESQLKKIIFKLREDFYNETLPLQQPNGDNVTIKRNVVEQLYKDLYKATAYFELIKPKNDPEYSDKFNRLKRSFTTINKLYQ